MRNEFKNIYALLLISSGGFFGNGLYGQGQAVLGFSALGVNSNNELWNSSVVITPLVTPCLQLAFGMEIFNMSSSYGIFSVNCNTLNNQWDSRFLFYPNPVHTHAYLQLVSSEGNSFTTQVQLQIIDAAARTLQHSTVDIARLESGYQLNVDYLPPGVYFLVVSSSTVVKTIKFIKLN